MNLILFETDEIKNDEITLPRKDPRAVHLQKVLKADKGTVFDAGIINAETGKARIEELSAETLTLSFTPKRAPEGLYPVTLILGLSRPQTIKKILRETTALGINRYILTGTERGEKAYSKSSALKPEALRNLFIEGAQQAFCTRLPEALFAADVPEALRIAGTPGSSAFITLDNYEAVISLPEYFKQNRKSENTIIAVGSERGWTSSERDAFREAGYTLCSLGRRVLRTETAAVAGTALCLAGMNII